MKLFVGNLSFETGESALMDLFSEFGTVSEATLIQDRMSGRSRGFAFVTMSSAAEGNSAVNALNGKNVDGRDLIVNEARPREQNGSRAGHGSHQGRRW